MSRWWLQDCRPDPYRVTDGNEPQHQEGLLADSPAQPDTMSQASEDGDEAQQPGGALPTASQLDAEMLEAQAATDRLEAAGPQQDPGHLPGLEESLQRRTMYPAGRILHLVPAFLVFTEEELQKLDPPDQDMQQAPVDPQAAAALQAATPVSPGPSWPKPPLWSSANLNRFPSSASSAAAAAAAEQVKGASMGISQQPAAQAAAEEASATTAALHAATAAPQTPLEVAAKVVRAVPGIKHSHTASQEQHTAASAEAQQPQPRQDAAKVWGGIEYDSNFADIDGTLHVFSDAAMTDDEDDAPPLPQQKYVLLDHVPQEAYGRIKLCSSMIQDHFIPCYSANMQTAMDMYLKYGSQT